MSEDLKEGAKGVMNDFLKYGRLEGRDIIIDDGIQQQKIGELTEKVDVQIPVAKTTEQLEEEAKKRKLFLECYDNFKQILEKYMVLNKRYYSITAIWSLGTWFHDNFPTYPYLFLNAMKGSGKTRMLKLISKFAKNGEILNSLTEAVLFRENGTLCIDEFEGISRVGKESLRELLNSAYKEGTKVKRMKKVKTLEGEKQIVEEFEVYRAIAMANIWGMEDVLGDRCITLIVEKSNDSKKSKLMEVFENDYLITSTLNTLNTLFTQKFSTQSTLSTQITQKPSNWCRLCSVDALRGVYMQWNDYITYTNTHYTLHYTEYTDYINKNNNTLNTLFTFFEKIENSEISGRALELAFPLFLIALELDLIAEENLLERESILDEILETFKIIFEEKRMEEFAENKDILIIDFFSQEPESSYWVSLSSIFQKFKDFSQINDEWLNKKWFGYRLRTLGLIKQKRRVSRGIEIIPNYAKAKEKIKMFRSEDEGE